MQIKDTNVREVEKRAALLAEKYNLKFVIIYGSVARGEAKSDSDVDIALLGKEDISFADLVSINNEFIDIFGSDNVDVKKLNKADSFFRYEVVKEGVLLYGDKRDYQFFKIYVFRSYCENRKIFSVKNEHTKKQLEDLLKNNNKEKK